MNRAEQGGTISKSGYYYIKLFLFRYILRIITLLFAIMTLLYHLIFLQMSRLLFFIISLSPKWLLFHLWHFYYFTYFYPHRLLLLLHLSHYICIIFIWNYYTYYPFRRLLCDLFLSAYILLLLLLLSHYCYNTYNLHNSNNFYIHPLHIKMVYCYRYWL